MEQQFSNNFQMRNVRSSSPLKIKMRHHFCILNYTNPVFRRSFQMIIFHVFLEGFNEFVFKINTPLRSFKDKFITHAKHLISLMLNLDSRKNGRQIPSIIEFFRIEFCRIYRIYRICRTLILVVLEIMEYAFWHFEK